MSAVLDKLQVDLQLIITTLPSIEIKLISDDERDNSSLDVKYKFLKAQERKSLLEEVQDLLSPASFNIFLATSKESTVDAKIVPDDIIGTDPLKDFSYLKLLDFDKATPEKSFADQVPEEFKRLMQEVQKESPELKQFRAEWEAEIRNMERFPFHENFDMDIFNDPPAAYPAPAPNFNANPNGQNPNFFDEYSEGA